MTAQTVNCCFQTTDPFNIWLYGNICCWDLNGTFLDAWDSSHTAIIGLAPKDDDLLVLGSRNNSIGPATRSSPAIGTACRVGESLAWDSAGLTYVNSFPGVTVTPYSYVTNSGKIWVYGSPDGTTFEDYILDEDGNQSAGISDVLGRVATCRHTSHFAVITGDPTVFPNTHHLIVCDDTGAVIWDKTITFANTEIRTHDPVIMALAPDDTVFLAGRLATLDPYRYVVERHSETAIVQTIKEGDTGISGVAGFMNTNMAVLSDNTLFLSWLSPFGIGGSFFGWVLQRYAATGNPPARIFSRDVTIEIPAVTVQVACDESDHVFLRPNSGPITQVNSSDGTTIATFKPYKMSPSASVQLPYTYTITNPTHIYAASGKLWIGGKRSRI